MKDNRPVNLDLGSMRWPITAMVSIAHRLSGLFLIAGVGLLICLLEMSLSSPEGFVEAAELLSGGLAKLVLWVVVSALAYHTFAGVKHLIMDMGYGETMEGGVLGAKIVIAATGLAVVLMGLWIW